MWTTTTGGHAMTEPTVSKMETTEALGRRAVACPGWKWVCGMRPLFVCDDGEVAFTSRVAVYSNPDGSSYYEDEPSDGSFPDLEDPATLGCLLHLVREAWSDEYLTMEWNRGGGEWWCSPSVPSKPGRDPYDTLFEGRTEAEALVAALEAAGGEG